MQDDRIKSLLENAEVKAPRRVWRNVAAQLDAATVREATASYDWMKWSGAAFAFASLVVGAILFFPRSASEETISVHNNAALAESAEIQVVTVPEPEETVSGTPVKESRKLLALSTGKPDADDIPAAVEPVEIVPAEPVGEEITETGSAVEPASSVKSVKEEPDGSAAKAFERMALEDEKEFSRGIKSLYAQGSIGGNDSDISILKTGGWMSSGSSEQKTGITELGESEYGIPLSVGVGFRYYILPRFSVGAGLDYSLLSRTFDGLYEEVQSGKVVRSVTGNVRHMMHYLGIPVNLYYDIITAEKIKFYVYGGGEMEYAVANKYTVPTSDSYINCSFPVSKLQWSVGAGLGVEFKLSELIGLYLDPSAKYYFECGQPNNVRTARPLMFNFDAGLRFNF